MNKQVLMAAAACAMLLTGCGKSESKSKDAASDSKSEPKIVAYNEIISKSEDSIEEQVTFDEDYIPDDFQPPLDPLEFQSGLELASIRSDKGTIPIHSDDNLRDVLSLTGLRYINWNQSQSEYDTFNFYGKGYAIADIRKGGDFPEGYTPAYVYMEVVNADDFEMGNLEADKSLYTICAVKATSKDTNDEDFSVGFKNGIGIGMTKEDIDSALTEEDIQKYDYEKSSLYIIGQYQVLYIEYNDENKADTIHSMPINLFDTDKFIELATPKEPEKSEESGGPDGSEGSEDSGEPAEEGTESAQE